MTVRLRVKYGKYEPNTLYAGSNEAQLVAQNIATTDLTGGVAYAPPDEVKYDTPVSLRREGTLDELWANLRRFPIGGGGGGVPVVPGTSVARYADTTGAMRIEGATQDSRFYPTTFAKFQAALAAAELVDYPVAIYLPPYLALTSPVTINMAKVSLIGDHSVIDASSLGGVPALTFDFLTSGGVTGFTARTAKVAEYRGFRLMGPGKDVAGSKGIFVNSSQSKSPRPRLDNVMVHAFEGGVTGQNQFFLLELHGCEIYDCKFGYWQIPGSDAGENCSIHGGVIHHNDCNIYLQEPSSGLNVFGTSLNYSYQQLITTAECHVSFFGCHQEFRGGTAGGDPVAILDGSGTDSRAPVPGKDSWMHLEGDGTTVYMVGGIFDINTSGGVGPYLWHQLINVVSAGAKVYIDKVYATNFRNNSNRLWKGAGRVYPGFRYRSSVNPSICSRATDQQVDNALVDYTYNTAAASGVRASALGVQQNVFMSLDAGDTIPTARLTGTNGNISIATPPEGNGSVTGYIGGSLGTVASQLLTVTAVTTRIVRGMVLTGTGVTAGTYVVGQVTGTTGGTGTYVVSVSQAVPSTVITGTVAKALKLTKTVTTTGSAGRCKFSILVPCRPGVPMSAAMLTMAGTTGAMAGSSVFVSGGFVSASALLDANGVPQITQRFATIASFAINVNPAPSPGVWLDNVLDAWNASAPQEAPAGATHYEIQFNCDNITTAGDLYVAFPHVTAWSGA